MHYLQNQLVFCLIIMVIGYILTPPSVGNPSTNASFIFCHVAHIMGESGKMYMLLCNRFLLQFIYNQMISNLYPVKDVSIMHTDFAFSDLYLSIVHWTHLQPGHFYTQFSIFKFYIIEH